MPHSKELNAEMRQCIANCLHCYAACIETKTHCLMLGGKHASPEHQKLLDECAQACLISANFMLYLSERHPQYCGLCAEVCDACAEDCERLGGGDQTMTQCAHACRRCAESCRMMAHAHA